MVQQAHGKNAVHRTIGQINIEGRGLEQLITLENSREFRLRTQFRGERTEIRIQMLSLNQMRMLSDRDGELQLLIWQRVDENGAGMDALAMR